MVPLYPLPKFQQDPTSRSFPRSTYINSFLLNVEPLAVAKHCPISLWTETFFIEPAVVVGCSQLLFLAVVAYSAWLASNGEQEGDRAGGTSLFLETSNQHFHRNQYNNDLYHRQLRVGPSVATHLSASPRRLHRRRAFSVRAGY